MRTFLAVILLLAAPASSEAAERSMRWARLVVTAHLDGNGVLHVEERHSIVFNGDWNGGERIFRDGLEDVLRLEHIGRLDEAGLVTPLRENESLDNVDEYAWHNENTLRWRSRLPSDPPFASDEITYVIAYTQSYILTPAGGGYRFDHNFGLPELEWPIDHYSLDLTLHSLWRPVDTVPRQITRSNLTRGENVTITARLMHTGESPPAAVNRGAPLAVRGALAAVLAATVALFVFVFVRRERKVGRFLPLIDPASIDQRWLDEHVLKFAPEVVGAAWDDRTGSAEVAAVIARMVQEGKLSSRVEKRGVLRNDNLLLTLARDRESFNGYEKAMVKALFIDGATTSTDKIKAHYKNKGFDPIAKIRGPVEKQVRSLSRQGRAPKIDWRMSALLAIAGVALLVAGGFSGPLDVVGGIVAGLIVVALYVAGALGALDYRRRVADLLVWSLEFVPAIVLIVATALFTLQLRLHPLTLAGIVLIALAAIRSILNIAKTRDGGERLENRRRLAAARAYFARELRRTQPALDDAWFPYLLAFGLGPHIDRWFRAFGGAATAGSSSFASTSSSHGSASSGRGWSGGGGAFGGAGATGSWAVAAAGMATGVSAPDSSGSGGGGGGGGGGSSGGGGGGGW